MLFFWIVYPFLKVDKKQREFRVKEEQRQRLQQAPSSFSDFILAGTKWKAD